MTDPCTNCKSWTPMPGLEVCAQCVIIVGQAAMREGWRPRGGAAMKPCRAAEHVCSGHTVHCVELKYHCHECNEEIHCKHCCNGAKLVLAGVTS